MRHPSKHRPLDWTVPLPAEIAAGRSMSLEQALAEAKLIAREVAGYKES